MRAHNERVERRSLNKNSDAIDSAAVIVLCLIALTSNLLIWVAGSPKYGVLSTVWQKVGIETLIGCSFSTLLIAALVLRRMYRAGSSRPHGLLVFAVASAIPFAFFGVILAARFLHGE